MICACCAVEHKMELFLPILGFAFLYLLSWIANVYLLIQLIIGVKAKRKHLTWSIIWLLAWLFFIPSVLLLCYTINRQPSLEQAVGSLCTIFVPLLWLVAFVLFRRAAAKDKRKDVDAQAELESQYILDIRHRDDVWPPPPSN